MCGWQNCYPALNPGVCWLWLTSREFLLIRGFSSCNPRSHILLPCLDPHLLLVEVCWGTTTCTLRWDVQQHQYLHSGILSLFHFHFTVLKRICILQLMITSKIYVMVSTKCKWISRCIHYKNNSTGWHQYDSFSIQHSNGHRHKTHAIARCFTFYTTVSPLRRKYMEERRERVIRLSSDSSSFLQNCMVDYFGELWCR